MLKDILYGVAVESVIGRTDVTVEQVAFDSRKVQPNTLFVAQKGLEFDGHHFIDAAVEKGAKVVICEVIPNAKYQEVTLVQVDDSDEALALVASNFYDNPSRKLKLIGVTGHQRQNHDCYPIGRAVRQSRIYKWFDIYDSC